jgi:hypothetical protein
VRCSHQYTPPLLLDDKEVRNKLVVRNAQMTKTDFQEQLTLQAMTWLSATMVTYSQQAVISAVLHSFITYNNLPQKL